MKLFLLPCLPFLLVACSVRPDHSVVYKTDIPDAGLRVIYDQRMPDFMGGEENVYAELSDCRRVQIDLNGRFSDHLNVDISEDGDWFRFYVKDKYSWVGHTEYRDVDGDGELDRVWRSENEDPAHARPHHYAVIAYLQREEGKVFRSNLDLVFKTSAAQDYFGSQVELESHQFLSGKKVIWRPMKRE